jgi:hypothetical protein
MPRRQTPKTQGSRGNAADGAGLQVRGEEDGTPAMEMGVRPAEEEPAVLDRDHASRWRATLDGHLGRVAAGQLLVQHGGGVAQGAQSAVNPRCSIGTDNAAEAVILEGTVESIDAQHSDFAKFANAYEKKYAWDVREMAQPVYRFQPSVGFGFFEKKFDETATRWVFR